MVYTVYRSGMWQSLSQSQRTLGEKQSTPWTTGAVAFFVFLAGCRYCTHPSAPGHQLSRSSARGRLLHFSINRELKEGVHPPTPTPQHCKCAQGCSAVVLTAKLVTYCRTLRQGETSYCLCRFSRSIDVTY